MKIFLVDDDDVFNYLNESIIRMETPDAHIQVFKSGEEVLSRMHEESDSFIPPDLMLLDIRMPNMDGFELLDKLENDSKLPFSNTNIHLLSSTLNEKDFERAKSFRSVKSFIGKPLTSEMYQAILKSIQNKH